MGFIRKIALLVFLLLVALSLSVEAQMGGGGGMGRGMQGMMLLSGGRPYRADGTMMQMSDAVQVATQYMMSRTSNLALDEIEEWEYNFYVVVKEMSPSNYKAYELVIDKWTGAVMPEPGPNLMWNTRYCRMMGYCGSNGSQSVSAAAAATLANQFLQQRLNRGRTLSVVEPPDLFYGFYTFDVKDKKTGAMSGMLSVNWATGQVWYHTWHGKFVQKREF